MGGPVTSDLLLGYKDGMQKGEKYIDPFLLHLRKLCIPIDTRNTMMNLSLLLLWESALLLSVDMKLIPNIKKTEEKWNA